MKAASASRKEIDVPAPPFRWGTRVVLPLVVLVAFAALFAGSFAASITPAVIVEAVPVVERPAIKKTVAQSQREADSVVVQAAGWIEPDPFAVYATALTGGTVQEVFFLEGESVEKDQILARLIDEDARLALRRAEAEANAAEEAWDANIEARRLADVTAATVRETSASLALARAELQAEEALLHKAKRIHIRRERLLSDGSISEEELDTAQAEARSQEARVRVTERRIDELEAQLERARAEHTASQRKLELRTEERRQLELARVALDEARLRVKRLEIRSPIEGVVMRRLVEPGSQVMTETDNMQAARVAELYNPERLQVRVDVPLADAAKVGVGQPARVVVEVLPDQVFHGTVTRLTNRADIQKNTLEVKVALKDPAPVLKPEMLARVRFLKVSEDEKQETPSLGFAVFAPESAISDNTAWLVSEFDGEVGIAKKTSVTLTGAAENSWVEVEEGLQPGDLLILPTEAPLETGQRVRVREGGV